MKQSNVEMLQGLMNEFYGSWEEKGNDDLSQEEIVEKYFKDKPVIAYAVALGNFNYQIGNGGISQWLFNDYAEFGLDRLIEILSKAIKYDPEKYSQLEFVVNQLKAFRNYENPHETSWEVDCEECGGVGSYEYESDDEDEECDCIECCGSGVTITQNYYDAVQHKIEYNFDSKFYAIKPDTVELFADIIADFDNIINQSLDEEKPDVGSIKKPKVQLVGLDGNIFSIIGRVLDEMRKAKVSREIIADYKDEVTSADSYDQALQVTMKYVDVC